MRPGTEWIPPYTLVLMVRGTSGLGVVEDNCTAHDKTLFLLPFCADHSFVLL